MDNPKSPALTALFNAIGKVKSGTKSDPKTRSTRRTANSNNNKKAIEKEYEVSLIIVYINVTFFFSMIKLFM